MLNNVSDENVVGQINGLTASMASLARTLGPFLAGFLFSWSAYSGNRFPLNYGFTFSFIAVFSLLNFCLSFAVSSEYVNSRRKK